jgi:hypothetical protein
MDCVEDVGAQPFPLPDVVSTRRTDSRPTEATRQRGGATHLIGVFETLIGTGGDELAGVACI